jgi:hypothetical protein
MIYEAGLEGLLLHRWLGARHRELRGRRHLGWRTSLEAVRQVGWHRGYSWSFSMHLIQIAEPGSAGGDVVQQPHCSKPSGGDQAGI